jgi:hypothetical protein
VIGGALYACGDGGQVYRRTGGALGAGQWRQLDASLLESPDAYAAALQRGPADRKIYFDVNGPREDELYVVGNHGTILAWDGTAFTRLPRVTSAALTEVLVEDEDRVWICGRNGTLLRGNRRDGFQIAAVSGRRQLFLSMTKLDGKIHLGSGADPSGVFVYERGSLREVSSGLDPDIEDVHTVDSADGVLWVVGSKDVLRYDGQRWERIDHVDNPPIRP